jgi:hypothetical protein
MQDHATRLGVRWLVVTEVEGTGERLDLQVELLARAGECPLRRQRGAWQGARGLKCATCRSAGV